MGDAKLGEGWLIPDMQRERERWQGAPPRLPVFVQCKPCGHRWAAVYLPMEAGLAARVLKAARCPNCGSTSRQHHLANEEAGRG